MNDTAPTSPNPDPIVSLAAVLDEMELPEGWLAFLNRCTGEVISLPGPDSMLFSDYDAEDDPTFDEIDDSPDWILLPTQEDIHEWDIMRRFAEETLVGEARATTLEALHGRGAFRMFRASIERLGFKESWYSYRDQALRSIAVAWLEDQGLRYR